MSRLSHHLRRALSFGLKLAFTLGALWLALRGVDFSTFSQLLYAQKYTLLLMASGYLLMQFVLGAERWRILLKILAPDHSGFGAVAIQKVYYASMFGNCCLPGSLGSDVARLWFCKSMHVPVRHVISSLIFDRALTLLALFVLAAVALPVIEHPVAYHTWKVMLVVLAICVVGACVPSVIKRILQRYERFHWLRHVHWLFEEYSKLLRQLRKILLILAYATTAHTCFALAAYYIAQSLSVEVSVSQMLALMPLVMLATALPVSIGGWGVREASVVSLLGLVGVQQDAALLLSLEIGVLLTLLSLPGLVFWLGMKPK